MIKNILTGMVKSLVPGSVYYSMRSRIRLEEEEKCLKKRISGEKESKLDRVKSKLEELICPTSAELIGTLLPIGLVHQAASLNLNTNVYAIALTAALGARFGIFCMDFSLDAPGYSKRKELKANIAQYKRQLGIENDFLDEIDRNPNSYH